MHLGLILPQIELPDPKDVAALARAAEESGYSHLLIYDHVLGADPSVRPGYWGPYDIKDPFHEPFVMLSYLAALTSLSFWTGILILPQRQTVLVAKQAASLDVVSDGRLTLGIGIGWNSVEFEALGEDFHNRGVRVEEQVALLRELWTNGNVDFTGRFHRVDHAGINPLPVQRPIPLWMGGLPVDRVLERIGRLADGWIAMTPPGHGLEEGWEKVQAAASAAGRDGQVGLHGTYQPGEDVSADRLRRSADRWQALGASHLSVSGMGAKRTPAEHISFAREVAKAVLG